MRMTRNRRIFLNIIATYGRSLYALVIGLFCGRWALMALGEVDFGLYGVIGGLMGFLSFLSSIMTDSIGRFFAVAIGEASVSKTGEYRKIRKWFTTAIVVCTFWPTAVVLIGYPVGDWAIHNYLNIPCDRILSCICVWRFVCVSFWISMLAAPMNAMYIAKQYIAELTVYSFCTTTLNACFGYYMITHPGDWLAKYAFWMCCMSILPMILISCRAFIIFQECRVERKCLRCLSEVKSMLSFSGWTLVSNLGALFANQGCMILVNKKVGPAANAGMQVGMSLAHHTEALGASLIGAFSPAIMNAYGAGDMRLFERLTYRVSKIAVLFLLLFGIPLLIEVREVLILWLKNPPSYAVGCCVLAILHSIIDKFSVGHLIAINAKGVIARFQIFVGSAWLFVLPLAYILMSLGFGVYSVLLALIIARIYVVFARVYFARKLLGFSAFDWIRRVLMPVGFVAVITYTCGYLFAVNFEQSFMRIVMSTCVIEILLAPLAWLIVLDKEERLFIIEKIRGVCRYGR